MTLSGSIRCVVVMGPSGNGKSTLARALADQLGWQFIEGDDHHPSANIAKMARAEPLTDEDRAPFLESIARALAAADGAVAACSALKRAYRERMVETAGQPILFVLPDVPPDELEHRMRAREGHFMPPALLASQIATLEAPQPDECHLVVDGMAPAASTAMQVARALESLHAG